jgi:hypothetical protein
MWRSGMNYAAICAAAGMDHDAAIIVPFLHLSSQFQSDAQAAQWINEQYAIAISRESDQ